MKREEFVKRLEQEKKERHEIYMKLKNTTKEIERLKKLQRQLEYELSIEDKIIKERTKDLKKIA